MARLRRNLARIQTSHQVRRDDNVLGTLIDQLASSLSPLSPAPQLYGCSLVRRAPTLVHPLWFYGAWWTAAPRSDMVSTQRSRLTFWSGRTARHAIMALQPFSQARLLASLLVSDMSTNSSQVAPRTETPKQEVMQQHSRRTTCTCHFQVAQRCKSQQNKAVSLSDPL